MHVFYTPDILSDTYTFNEEERRHGVQVLRLSAGDQVILVDGIGGYYTAAVTTATKKQLSVQVLSVKNGYNKRSFTLHVAVAPTKNIERIEWFIEKATELGIDEISMILCERSERRVVKEDRLNKVITAAVKQSMQAYHPVLHPTITFKEFISRQSGHVFIAHCGGGDKCTIQSALPRGEQCTILIGPEGDFSDAELALALANGCVPISLGTNRLRTETAALAACFEANFVNR